MAEEESLTPSSPLGMEDTFTHWSRLVEITFHVNGTTNATTAQDADQDDVCEDTTTVQQAERVLAIEQDPDSFILGTTVWDSSKTLLKYIEQNSATFRKFSSICELGSGCGALAGMASAINNQGHTSVVLTDIGSVLPWLRRNVESNLTLEEQQNVFVEEYVWGTPLENAGDALGTSKLAQLAPFDCILCADVVYEKEFVRPLMQSILRLSSKKTEIYFVNEKRAKEVYDEFFQVMNEYFVWTEILDKSRQQLAQSGFLKPAIQLFQLRPKKRKVPREMQLVASDKATEYHPLFKAKLQLHPSARVADASSGKSNVPARDGETDEEEDDDQDHLVPPREDPTNAALWEELLR